MTTDPTVLTDAVRVALAENGVGGPDSSLHGWRCAYPDRYGECDCVAEVVADAIAAARPIIEAEVRERIAAEIEALPPEHATGSRDFGRGYSSAVRDAARIARGAS